MVWTRRAKEEEEEEEEEEEGKPSPGRPRRRRRLRTQRSPRRRGRRQSWERCSRPPPVEAKQQKPMSAIEQKAAIAAQQRAFEEGHLEKGWRGGAPTQRGRAARWPRRRRRWLHSKAFAESHCRAPLRRLPRRSRLEASRKAATWPPPRPITPPPEDNRPIGAQQQQQAASGADAPAAPAAAAAAAAPAPELAPDTSAAPRSTNPEVADEIDLEAARSALEALRAERTQATVLAEENSKLRSKVILLEAKVEAAERENASPARRAHEALKTPARGVAEEGEASAKGDEGEREGGEGGEGEGGEGGEGGGAGVGPAAAAPLAFQRHEEAAEREAKLEEEVAHWWAIKAEAPRKVDLATRGRATLPRAWRLGNRAVRAVTAEAMLRSLAPFAFTRSRRRRRLRAAAAAADPCRGGGSGGGGGGGAIIWHRPG